MVSRHNEAIASKQNIHQLDPEHPANEFKKVWKQLSITNIPNGHLVLYDKSRIVPPETAIRDLLEDLHQHHASAGSIVDTIRMSYYWPRYEAQVHDYVRNCGICEEIRRMNFDPPPCRPTRTST